jgi:hypothetical protein
VTFPVTVPETGDYVLGITYGTDTTPVTLGLAIDASPAGKVPAPPTLYSTYAGRLDTPVTLTAGAHEVTLTAGLGEVVAIDRISLTRAGSATRRYDAVFAWRTGGAVDHTAALHGPGAVTLAGADELTFFIAVAATGRYALVVAADSGVGAGSGADTLLAVNGVAVGAGAAEVYLAVGVSVVTVRAAGTPVRMHSLSVTGTIEKGAGIRVSAEQFTLTEPVRLADDVGTAYLDGFEPAGSAAQAGSAAIELPGLDPGAYLLTLEYSNADRSTGHMYNADVINRRLAIQRGTDVPTVVVLRHNYHWSNYQPLTVPFQVVADTGAIRLTAADGPGPRIVAVQLNPLVVSGGGA